MPPPRSIAALGHWSGQHQHHIVDGVAVEDPVGLECKNDADAKIKAAFIASQIAIDLDKVNEVRRVIAFDDRGIEIGGVLLWRLSLAFQPAGCLVSFQRADGGIGSTGTRVFCFA